MRRREVVGVGWRARRRRVGPSARRRATTYRCDRNGSSATCGRSPAGGRRSITPPSSGAADGRRTRDPVAAATAARTASSRRGRCRGCRRRPPRPAAGAGQGEQRPVDDRLGLRRSGAAVSNRSPATRTRSTASARRRSRRSRRARPGARRPGCGPGCALPTCQSEVWRSFTALARPKGVVDGSSTAGVGAVAPRPAARPRSGRVAQAGNGNSHDERHRAARAG